MDLGAAAEGLALARHAELLLCTLAIHLVAVVIASFASFYPRGPAVLLSSVAVAMVVANHLALLVMGFWREVVLGCPIFWTHCLMAAVGWILLIAIRVHTSRNPVRPAVKYSAAAVLILVGLCIAFAGLRAQFQPRSNMEDDISLATGAVGLALIGAGASLPFARGPVVLGVAICTPYAAYVLAVGAFWGAVLLRTMING